MDWETLKALVNKETQGINFPKERIREAKSGTEVIMKWFCEQNGSELMSWAHIRCEEDLDKVRKFIEERAMKTNDTWEPKAFSRLHFQAIPHLLRVIANTGTEEHGTRWQSILRILARSILRSC